MSAAIRSIARLPWARLCGAFLLGAVIPTGCQSLAIVPEGRGGDPLEGLAGRGWRIVEPARTFGPQTLYEEIDGEAELYLPYSFRELRVAILSHPVRPSAQLRLEISRHGSARDAYGIYSQHRFPGQETTRVGSSEAILSNSSLDFFQGEFFVRIRTASRQAARGDLERLGTDLAGLLPGRGDFPREAEALRVPGSAQGPVVFHRRAILGYEALAPGFESGIDDGTVSGKILLFTEQDVGPAASFLERLAGALRRFSPAGGGYYRAVLPSGTLWLLSRDRYHLGFAGKATHSQAEAVLSELDRRAALLLSGRREDP